jgi:thioredoxin-dependent peroxiredoxin
MALHPGMPAPAFQVEDLHGNPVALDDYVGKTLLLSFFRNSACALCNLRVHLLIQRYPQYQARGLEIVAVFESPRDSMLQYVGRQQAPFPLIADPQALLYRLYEVETSEEKVAVTMAMPETQQHIAEAAAAGFALTREPGSNFHRIPADFLIGPDLLIQRAHYAQHITDHLPFEEIERFLEQPVAHEQRFRAA